MEKWKIDGELALSCNCTVFCPCSLSRGMHPPTEGYCQTWIGIRIDDGHFGDVDLSGLNAGLIVEIPGLMIRGNWTAGLFIDERASIYAVKGLTRILTGQAGGSLALLKTLVGKFLGVRQAPITYETEGQTRKFTIEKIVDGVITPVRGKTPSENVVISNADYWIAPDIIVCKADRSRVRVFGRNWQFDGRSAEICQLNWKGP